MGDDNRPLTTSESIAFICFMARLLPALDIPSGARPTWVARALGLPPTPRNLALIDDIQSYRTMVWDDLPVSTKIEIAFGDSGAPSDFDFYFDRQP